MAKLALFGGPKVRSAPFPRHPIIGEEEKKAVLKVLESGRLSSFIAQPGEFFLGGERIRQFERDFAKYHRVDYAVAFNSATSALHAAVVAVGVKPGEEVIVPPYTFTSTATCVLMHNAIPVFADVKPDIFCIDSQKIEENISPLTRAVIPVHLFGHPADMDEIMAVAAKYDLKLIEDCAQAPGAVYKGKPVGTIGDCGVFSFTESKNITTGEGGMLVTNDSQIADIARMIRNHGEVLLESQTHRTYRSEILGWNYRMTELEAALGIEQLKKMDWLNERRIELARYLTKHLPLNGFTPPTVYPFVKHVYYVCGLKYDEEQIGVSRNRFCEALNAEGIPCGAGYIKPLYLSPLYHENKPYAFSHYKGNAKYDKGICPVAEALYEKEMIVIPVCRPPATFGDMDDIIEAFLKIIANKHEFSRAGLV